LLITGEILAETLEINPNTLVNWELNLGVATIMDNSGQKVYSQQHSAFFKKVKSLILNGYNFATIKDLLTSEIDNLNKIEVSQEVLSEKKNAQVVETAPVQSTVVYLNRNTSSEQTKQEQQPSVYETKAVIEPEQTSSNQEEKPFNSVFNTFNDVNTGSLNQPDVISLFEVLLKELKQYTDRTIEAEKKIYLLEDYERRVKQEYFEVSSEIKQLKMQLEEKEQKLKDYEDQKKRLNLMEVQMKIMQLANNKKKFWEFWKQ
jgi:DNA-binding transcriptional MerR regulator